MIQTILFGLWMAIANFGRGQPANREKWGFGMLFHWHDTENGRRYDPKEWADQDDQGKVFKVIWNKWAWAVYSAIIFAVISSYAIAGAAFGLGWRLAGIDGRQFKAINLTGWARARAVGLSFLRELWIVLPFMALSIALGNYPISAIVSGIICAFLVSMTYFLLGVWYGKEKDPTVMAEIISGFFVGLISMGWFVYVTAT